MSSIVLTCPIHQPCEMWTFHTSTVSRAQTVVNRKSWLFHTSPVKRGCPVCRTREYYIDSCGKLPEDREGDGNAGNLPRLYLAWR